MHHRTHRPLRLAVPMALILAAAMSVDAMVRAETLEGRLNGQSCAQRGHLCPARNLDAHLSFELDFVLLQADGGYWFLSNVPREAKVRHVLKQVRVRGSLNETYRSIDVDALMVRTEDGFETVWTPRAQQQAFEAVYQDGWFSLGDDAHSQ
ncbi:hypothetical protein [uncultured Thiohalocapsa sp.]|uniref:hypothetical protein n=1 Tax=uncultured Thiohalocapsa sp. TaxID=768990 RepID=UPI0025D48BE9|nr:hypothetical protein [uncultured Thiohalocapsa sp.]